MYAAFCGEIVKHRWGHPDRDIEGNEIFRVDVMVQNVDGQPIIPQPAPIEVSSGECQVHGGDQTFLPIYPGRMKGWLFVNGNVQKEGTEDSGIKYRRVLIFEALPDADVQMQDFDFTLACEATLADPTVQNLIANYEKRLTNIDLIPNSVSIYVKGKANEQGIGAFAGNIFDTSSEECVEQR